MSIRNLIVALVAVLMVSSVGAQEKVLTPTPPMGWNSWDSYGLTITEPQFRANVDVLAKTLKPFGWNYAVIDEGWFMQNPLDRPHPELLRFQIDAYGRYIPVPARFPSSAKDGGFKALGGYVHELGLKFGIHIVRGIPRESVQRDLPVEGSQFKAADVADQNDACPWDPTNWGVRNNAAGQAWYDSLMRQYAGWGVDYIKVDCIAAHPYKGDEIRMIHRAIVRTGRPIVLSLSPGPAPLDKAAELGENAQLWRISNDVWDHWEKNKEWSQNVRDQFEVIASWTKYVKPGNWPDADMLPLGMLEPVPGDGKPRATRLTPDEQRTMVTLWSIARSPLFIGANLTKLDDWTAGLLTNSVVVAMDQQGHGQRLAGRDGDVIAWTSKVGDKEYLALFNVGDSAAAVKNEFTKYGLAGGKYEVRDIWGSVWEAKNLGRMEGASGTVAPHGCLLLELRR